MRASLRRVVLLALLVMALVGGGVADRLVARTTPPSPPTATVGSVTAAAPGSAESSAWYCAGGTGAQGGAPASVVVTNFNARPVNAALSTVAELPASGSGSPAGAEAAPAQRLVVPGGGQLVVPSTQLGQSGALAAAVVVNGGRVTVSEVVSSPLGWSMAPCASSAAPQWYFAHGATTQGGGLVLSLFNPGSTDSTVDISLVTSTAGDLAPPAYQGVDIPAHTLVTENLGDHIVQDPAVATVVSSLSGTVVASELQSLGKPGAGGIALTLGTPSPATEWSFPQNTDVTGGTVAFHVLNASSHAATVSVAIGLPKGAGAEPLSMSVPAQSTATLQAQSITRIPANTPYALTFVSKGSPIVVQRQVTSPSGAPASEPANGEGPGVPGGATHWLIPAPASPGNGAWALAVVDLGRDPARVHILDGAGRALGGRNATVVDPGTPLFVGPNPDSPFGAAPFQLTADQPVAVELDGVPVASPGVVVVPAFEAR